MNIQEFAATIKAEGWEREEGEGYHDGYHGGSYGAGFSGRWVVLRRDAIHLVFNLRSMKDGTFDFSGHTRFRNAEGAWFSFSRRGIDDSFYGDESADIPALIEKQLQRAQAGIARSGDFVDVPGLGGLRIHKNKLDKARRILAAGGEWSFMPAGFGTGYRASKRQYRWTRRAKPETEAFLGASPLYLESLDCD